MNQSRNKGSVFEEGEIVCEKHGRSKDEKVNKIAVVVRTLKKAIASEFIQELTGLTEHVIKSGITR